MTATATEKKLSDMSPAELKVRAAELRVDLASIPAGERADGDSSRYRAIQAEADLIDTHLLLANAISVRETGQRADVPGPRGATAEHGATFGLRSVGQALIDDPMVRAFMERGLRSPEGGLNENGAFNVELQGVRATTVSEFGAGGPGNASSTGTNTLLPVGQPIPPVPRQGKLFMRDLIPSMATTLAQVPYVRELNPTGLEGGATSVAEGSLKPDGSLSFQGDNAYVTVIAVNLSPTKQLWEDAPAVAAYINGRLPYLVRLREDAEFYAGGGNYPDIKGITTFTQILTDAGVAGDNAISIANGIAKVEGQDGYADGVVMNHNDAWTMFKKRASGGSGTFDAGTIFSLASPEHLTVWGLPVLRSRIYTAGKALVGDFGHGAMILDRESVNVQIYPQHSTYAAQNMILVQCETRVGLMVPRPDLFCNVTLS